MTGQQKSQQDGRRSDAAQLLDALSRLIRTARAAGQRQQAEFGLSGTPLGILTSLAVADARPGDLAGRLQITPSVVSRSVVPLEQSGLVERRTDPDDTRAVRLGLTEAGRRRLSEAREDFADRFSPLLADWDRGEVADLTQLVGRLESALNQPLHPGSGHEPPVHVAS